MADSHESYAKLFDLSDRVVVVTGGNGILGRGYAAALAEYGARVAVVDLDEAASVAHAEELTARFGRPALGVGLDVADQHAVAAAVERIEAELGPIAVLLNNAASKGDDLTKFFAPTETYDLETWRQIMAVNLDGAFLMARDVGGRMARRGGGSIINVASIYGCVGPDPSLYEGSEYMGMAINTPAVYSASKAGVIGLTRYLATLWGAAGVRVNTLTPGGVQSGQNETFLTRYGQRTPLGRMAERREMIGAVLYLASDASTYVTGHNLMVDGGWSIW